MATTQRPPQFFEIPLGTEPTRCKGCDATIYFVTTRNGKQMPVSIAAEGCRAPDTFPKGQQNLFGGTDEPQPGRGISHFVDCPDAQRFRSER